MIIKGGGGIINKMDIIEVRCKNCNRKLFMGSIGVDYCGQPKTVEIKCPRCGTINIITCEIEEKVVVRVKE